MHHENRAPTEFDRLLLARERSHDEWERRNPERARAERSENLAVAGCLYWTARKQKGLTVFDWLELVTEDELEPLHYYWGFFEAFEQRWAARNARRNT